MCGAFVLSFELTFYVDENDLPAICMPSATVPTRAGGPRLHVCGSRSRCKRLGGPVRSPLRRPLEMCEAPLVCPCLVPA